MSRAYDTLRRFLSHMRMPHLYQPLMLMTLLKRSGRGPGTSLRRSSRRLRTSRLAGGLTNSSSVKVCEKVNMVAALEQFAEIHTDLSKGKDCLLKSP